VTVAYLGCSARFCALGDARGHGPAAVTGTPQGGVYPRCLLTSTCTGSTGHGVARTGRRSGTPMIWWCSAGPRGRRSPRWRG